MADVELLPLPEHFAHQSERVQEHIRNYARANVAVATATLQAEIEALRKEVAFGRKLNADLINACALANTHSERLEEALWLIESAKGRGFGIDYARGVAQSVLRDHDKENKA